MRFHYNLIAPFSTTPQLQKVIAIVGGGPAGFYSAKKILGDNPNARVHVFEGLPFPFGLVRYGVAPDHQSIKNITKDLTEVIKNQRLAFFGNVNIGKDIQVQELEQLYSGVLYAYGAQEDKKLGIEGEDTRNVLSGRQVINWYNGHPEFTELPVDFSKVKNVVIIGNGNVALDVARVLSKARTGQLDATDIAEHALSKLKENAIQNVTILLTTLFSTHTYQIYIIARRGHIQSQFSMKEFRAFTQTAGVKFYLQKDEMERSLSGNSKLEYYDPSSNNRVLKMNQRRVDLLQTMNVISSDKEAPHSSDSINIHLKALLSPLKIHSNNGQLSSIEFARNTLSGQPFKQKASVDTSLGIENIEADLVIRCIGYESTNIAPNYLPWNSASSTLSNQNGCILSSSEGSSSVSIGKYTSGWVKTGAVGVLDQTMIGCIETTNNIDIHLSKDALKSVIDPEEQIKDLLSTRGVKRVSAKDWDLLDAIEVQRGKQVGKIREKLISVSEALSLLS